MHKALITYYEEHRHFDAHTAQKWLDHQTRQNWGWSTNRTENIFLDALIDHDEDFIALLSPKFERGTIADKTYLIQSLYHDQKMDVLERVVPWVDAASLSLALTNAMIDKNVDAAKIFIPFAKTKSQNSQYLQWAVRNETQSERLNELLDVIIPASEPKKAAHHLLAQSESSGADLIMAHPKTPKNMLDGFLRYAATVGAATPLSKARYEKECLVNNLSGPALSKTRQRKM